MYTFVSAVKNLYRNKFLNCTVIVSFALGMLFPLLVFCVGNIMLKSIWTGIAIYPERVIALYTDDSIRINTEKAKADHSEIEVIMETAFTANDYVSFDEGFIEAQIIGNGAGNEKIIRYEMLSGRYLTDEEANGSDKICLISSTLQRELGCGTGDIIRVGGSTFEIKGVYIENNAELIMPLESFSQIYYTRYAYNIQLKSGYEAKSTGARIANELADEYGIPNRDFLIADSYYDTTNDLKNAAFALFIMLGIASVVLLYSALNVSNILVNKIHSDMKNYIIKIQLGASKSTLFEFLSVQLFILMLGAVFADIAAVAVIKSFMPYVVGFPFELSPLAVLMTVGIGTVYVLLLSFVLLKKIYGRRNLR